jgi:hypothetical protein
MDARNPKNALFNEARNLVQDKNYAEAVKNYFMLNI